MFRVWKRGPGVEAGCAAGADPVVGPGLVDRDVKEMGS